MTDARQSECDAILDAIPDLVMVLDRENRIVRANKALLARCGEEIVGRKCYEVIHGAKEPVDSCPHAALLTDGREHIAEITEEALGGTFIVSASPLRDPDGSLRGAVHVARDISQRREAEDALRVSEERLRTILDNVPVMIALLSPDGRHTWVNRCWEQTLGWSLEEAGQHDVLTSTYPDPDVRQQVADHIARADGSWSDFKTRTRGGELVDTTWVNVRLTDGSKIGMGLDITERKRAVAAVKESEERFRSLVESSMDAVLLTAPDGRVLSANEAACRMFGRTEQELIELGRDGVVDATDPRLAAALEERAQTGKFRGELTYVRKDGSRFPGEVSSVIFTDRNGEARTSMSIRDITSQKRAEGVLRASEKQLRALAGRVQAAREEERAGLARDLHDNIGTELSALGMGLGAARIQAERAGNDALAKSIADAEQAVEHITREVRLSIAQLRPDPLEDYGLLTAVRSLAERVSAQTGLDISVTGDEEKRMPKAAETALYRIAQEALANVARHARAAHAVVLLTEVAGGLRLSVRDDGCGFESDAARVASLSGGMGLIDMRERARSIGARFTVRSSPGSGTEVVVELSDENSDR